MIEQLVIAICGIGGVWLSQAPTDNARRWACILGLISQPAWFYATYQAEQWGIFALGFLYAAGYLRGLHTFWIRRRG